MIVTFGLAALTMIRVAAGSKVGSGCHRYLLVTNSYGLEFITVVSVANRDDEPMSMPTFGRLLPIR